MILKLTLTSRILTYIAFHPSRIVHTLPLAHNPSQQPNIMSAFSVSGAATPVDINAASTTPTNSVPADKTDSITIVLSIIGTILTLASVTVAVLQYRIQRQRRRDVERDSRAIEMTSQRSVQGSRGTMGATPP